MKRVSLTRPAERDRSELWSYIAEDNPVVADQWLDEMDRKLRLLAGAPGLGRARPDIAPQLRQFPIGNYVIFYVADPDGITVIRILHGARQLKDLL